MALDDDQLLIHPFIIGEIALGSIKDRAAVIREIDDLHRTEIAEHEEVMGLIERHDLHGRGIGYVDAHLLASALLTPGAHLWTRKRRPHAAAEHLSVAARDEET